MSFGYRVLGFGSGGGAGPYNVQYLVVGGGAGGGGGHGGGGGGAGGYRTISTKAFEVDGQAASATRMRNAFKDGDWDTFKKLMPDDNQYDNVVQVLNGQEIDIHRDQAEDSMVAENFFSMPHLFSLVDEVSKETSSLL